MSLHVTSLGPSALELDVQQKLSKDDYLKFVPLAERRIEQYGKVGLLVHLSNFAGWSPSALWQDIKFDTRHYHDVSRLAIVGEGDTKTWMATLARPFTTARVQYFPESQLEDARAWVRGGSAS